jgi:hypothetical protein
MGILSHSCNKAALNWSRVVGHSDTPLLSCPFHPTDVRMGTNLDSTEANRVGYCYDWRENLDKLWLHGAGCYPAGKLGDALAQMELQPAGGFHPYILRLLNYRLPQSTATLTHEISLPRP